MASSSEMTVPSTTITFTFPYGTPMASLTSMVRLAVASLCAFLIAPATAIGAGGGGCVALELRSERDHAKRPLAGALQLPPQSIQAFCPGGERSALPVKSSLGAVSVVSMGHGDSRDGI